MKAVRFSIKCGVVNEHAMLKCELSHAMMLIHHVRQWTPCLTMIPAIGFHVRHVSFSSSESWFQHKWPCYECVSMHICSTLIPLTLISYFDLSRLGLNGCHTLPWGAILSHAFLDYINMPWKLDRISDTDCSCTQIFSAGSLLIVNLIVDFFNWQLTPVFFRKF